MVDFFFRSYKVYCVMKWIAYICVQYNKSYCQFRKKTNPTRNPFSMVVLRLTPVCELTWSKHPETNTADNSSFVMTCNQPVSCMLMVVHPPCVVLYPGAVCCCAGFDLPRYVLQNIATCRTVRTQLVILGRLCITYIIY